VAWYSPEDEVLRHYALQPLLKFWCSLEDEVLDEYSLPPQEAVALFIAELGRTSEVCNPPDYAWDSNNYSSDYARIIGCNCSWRSKVLRYQGEVTELAQERRYPSG
jgi:hypothetical protein